MLLDIRLQPKQYELYEILQNRKTSWNAYGGSRGGSKSGAARRLMILRRLSYPGTNGLIFRRVFDELKKNHIDPMLNEFPELLKYYSVSNHEIGIPVGKDGKKSRIIFGYAEGESELKRKFWGQEYQDIFVDQGEQLTENEHRLLKTSNRWPFMPDNCCKYVIFFNPGGVGIDFLRRVFFERNYRDREDRNDYSFIQAYGWDNYVWVREALEADYPIETRTHFPECKYPSKECKCLEKLFYSWDGDVNGQRFQYFITKSQYGRELNALPEALRIGHLLGSLDKFAGQYFDNFNSDVHVVNPLQLDVRSWHPKWISIDWGYSHPAAVYWHSQEGPVTKTYRELVVSNRGPKALAESICKPTLMNQESIDAIYLSPDAFAKRTDEDTIEQQMTEVFRQNKLPSCSLASNDRIGGWMLMRELLQYNQWIMSSECPELIRSLPMMSRDENNMEDCVKFDGDDPPDSARYGLKSRHTGGRPPLDVEVMARLNLLPGVSTDDVHTRYLMYKKIEADEKKKRQAIKNWHSRRSFGRYVHK